MNNELTREEKKKNWYAMQKADRYIKKNRILGYFKKAGEPTREMLNSESTNKRTPLSEMSKNQRKRYRRKRG